MSTNNVDCVWNNGVSYTQALDMLVGLVQSGRAVAQSFGQLFQTVQRDRAPPPTLLKQVCARGMSSSLFTVKGCFRPPLSTWGPVALPLQK